MQDRLGADSEFVHEFLFADNTLIIDEHGQLAYVYMHCIPRQGAYYRLTLS